MARMSRYQGWRKSLGCKLFEKSPFYSFECPSQHFVSRSGSTGAYTKRLFFLGLITPSSASLICSAKPTDLVFGGVFCRSFHGIRPTALGDFYKIMGVNKDASPEEIKKAYFALAKKLHPDVNRDTADTRRFQEVQYAYEVLKDEERRLAYNQVVYDSDEQVGEEGSRCNPFYDLYNDKKIGGKDIEGIMKLSFLEAALGCKKTITIHPDVPCQACNGTGVRPRKLSPELKAHIGSGTARKGHDPFSLQTSCSLSGGSNGGYGEIVSTFHNCKTCKGRRVIQGTRSIKLEVMPGVASGETIRIIGNGGADPCGNIAGDLYVTFKVNDDSCFWREGCDVHITCCVGVSKAMLGGIIQIPTLTGHANIKVPGGIQSGQKAVLEGIGIKRRNSTLCGNQYLHFQIIVPVRLTSKQRMLLEEFEREENHIHNAEQFTNSDWMVD